MMEEIVSALRRTHCDDLEKIRLYAAWIKIRRMVNDRFYFAAHWVKKPIHFHWLGRNE